MSTAVDVRLVPAPPPPADPAGPDDAPGAPAPGRVTDRATHRDGPPPPDGDRPPPPGDGARPATRAPRPASPGGPAPAGPEGESPADDAPAPRRRRARTAAGGRPEQPRPPGPCAPVVERLGDARVQTYHHASPAAPARPTSRARMPRLPLGASLGGAPGLDPRQACCMVALAAVEVLTGNRPLAQLARWLTPEVYDGLARRAALTAPGTRVLDAAATARDVRQVGTDRGPTGIVRRPSVLRVRTHRVDDDTLEAAVVVAQADRARAVAVRLTRTSGRWRAAALVVG